MIRIEESDRARIADAIKSVEATTRGELVAVLARESDDYYYIPTLWAALVALALPGIMAFFPLFRALPADPYVIQVAGFILLAALFRLPLIKYRLVPKAVKLKRARRMAREQFLEQGLHLTAERSGILFFVSVAEHYVELLADKGINDAVESGAWDHVVAAFVNDIKAGEVASGFVRAIEACGGYLAENYPIGEGDKDELSNHLIEI